MIFLDGGLLLFALWVFCIIDVIVVDEFRVRNLPKGAWIVIVLLLPDIGSIAWLVAGRPWDSRKGAAPSRVSREYPEYDRPGRYVPASPEDDEEFLRGLRARAEEQRERARRERLAREAGEEEDRS